MQSHIRKVYACLAVTCHLHFWQNDRGLLRATAVTRGWNRYRNVRLHSQHFLHQLLLVCPLLYFLLLLLSVNLLEPEEDSFPVFRRIGVYIFLDLF